MRNVFRQTLLTVALASAGALSMIGFQASAAPAVQAVAQQQMQVPGYYRMMLGKMEITALYDGYVQLDTKLFIPVILEAASLLATLTHPHHLLE